MSKKSSGSEAAAGADSEQHPATEMSQAPSVEEKQAAQNEANLQRAISEGGYKPEPEPSRDERARTLVAEMDHAVANNGPITVAMMAQLRDLLGVAAR